MYVCEQFLFLASIKIKKKLNKCNLDISVLRWTKSTKNHGEKDRLPKMTMFAPNSGKKNASHKSIDDLKRM